MAESLAPVMYWALRTTLCSVLAVGDREVAISGSDATHQDALNGAAVKPFEDLRTHAKYFQSPEGEWVFTITSSIQLFSS